MDIFTRGQDATFSIHLDELSSSSPTPTLEMVDSDGAEVLASSTLTRDTSVATTLAEFAKRGSLFVRVSSATGVLRGGEYLIGDADTEVPERRRVVQVLGDRLKLAAPLFYDHQASKAVVSTKLSCAIDADTFDEVVRYGRARATYTAGGVEKVRDVQFAVSEHAFRSSLTTEIVGISDPAVQKRLTEGVDITGVMALAKEILDEDIGTRFEPFLIRGESPAYQEAHRLKTLELLATPDRPEHMALYAKQYEAKLSIVITEPTVDHDDDDAVGPAETAFFKGRRWGRR